MATVATTYTMPTMAVEKSSYTIPITSFRDDSTSPTAITPQTMAWSLHNGDDAVVNSRSSVSVTAASTLTVTLSGNDLALPDQEKAWRYLTVEYTYNSDLGNDLPGKQLIAFRITPLGTVS